ncbi:MAG: HAD family hydrolase [Vulcanimicrobiaceae bacterium]
MIARDARRSCSPFEAVLFDLDDTLHDDTYAFESATAEVAAEVAQECGVDARRLNAAYIAQAEAFWGRLNAEGLSRALGSVRRELWAVALRDVGLDDPALAATVADRYNRYRRKYFAPFPGALALLESLRAQGCRLGIITNGFSETHREKIALLQIGDYVDKIFIADEVGMLKPDPNLFLHACDALGAAPERSAMVGDRYDRDVSGARIAGLYTIWLNIRREPLPAGSPPPDAACTDIQEVGRLLKAASIAT